MITFSSDPQTAEQQMRAVIFYLTAFGYIDGELDAAEKRYVRDFAGKLVIDRARAAGARRVTFLGGEATIHKGFHEAVARAVALGFEEIVNAMVDADLAIAADAA